MTDNNRGVVKLGRGILVETMLERELGSSDSVVIALVAREENRTANRIVVEGFTCRGGVDLHAHCRCGIGLVLAHLRELHRKGYAH